VRVQIRSRNDDGVFHGAGIFENLDDLRNRRAFLTNRVIDADEVIALAVDDGVKSDRGFSRLAIADDQLALTAAIGIMLSMAFSPEPSARAPAADR